MVYERLQYKGPSRDPRLEPWLRLVHGRHYLVNYATMSSGRVRVNVKDLEDDKPVKLTYKDFEEFTYEWIVTVVPERRKR